MSVTVEIDGVGEVQFDDSFKDLTREQQQRLVNRIAEERATLENKKKRKEEDDGYLANLARTAVGQGALLGFGDEVEAGLRTGFGLLGDYGATRDEIRGQVKDFAAENPATALAAEIGGGLLTGGVGGARAAGTAIGRKVLEKAGTAGLAAGIGATEGAIAGVGSGETAGERLAGGAVGATLGGALGAAAPAAIGAVKAGVGRVRSGVSDKAAQEAADLKALQSIEEGGMSPEDVLRGLDETRASGVTDAMIPDIAGDATRGLARGASTVSGEGRVIAQKALDERAANLGDEIANDVGNVLAGGKSASEALDEIATRQAANAGNDYDAAFNVDGAPVTVPVTDKLKNLLTLPAFDEAVEQADQLARVDRVGLPSAKDLIDGKKIDDLSIRELHYIKMGLDEVLGLGKRGQSKTSIGRGLERGLKNARAELIEIIDDASPQIDGESAYKTARNKFAGDARLREAIEDGEGFFRMKPDELEAKVGKMSDSEKEAFRIGVAQAVRNSVDSTADLADAGKKIFGNKKQRKLLRAAFPDDKTFEAFEKRMEARIEQVITRGYAPRSGSPTALRDQDVSNLSETADAVTSMLMGNPLPAARSALGQVTDRASTSGRVGRALSQDLFSTDPAAQREFLERLARRRAAEQARMARAGRLAGGYGGTAGVFGGLLTGER
tara:strand:- start:519 stop:2528 length:2010 start_codon:yes stop_codon:yes gene_type:complete